MRSTGGAEASAILAPVGGAVIDALAELVPGSLGDEDLLDLTADLLRQISWAQSVRAQALAEVARRDRGRGGKEWAVEQITLTSSLTSGEARLELRTASALAEKLPATAGQLRAGELTWGHAVALAQETRTVDEHDAGEVERLVLSDPAQLTSRQFRDAARAIVLELNPDAAAKSTPTPSAKSYVDREGNHAFHARLDAYGAYTLSTALHAAGQRTGTDDERPIDHRLADALVEISESWLRQYQRPTRPDTGSGSGSETGTHDREADGREADDSEAGGAGGGDGANCTSGASGASTSSGGRRPQVTVTMTLPTLLGLSNAPGRLGNGDHVSAEIARRIACDADLTRLITDPLTGGVIDLARSSRHPTAAQRRRILARDQGCRYPTCTREPDRCQVHHCPPWKDGGLTNENSQLTLCWRHHCLAHEGGWTVDLNPDNSVTWTTPTGRSYTHAAPGTEIPDPPWA